MYEGISLSNLASILNLAEHRPVCVPCLTREWGLVSRHGSFYNEHVAHFSSWAPFALKRKRWKDIIQMPHMWHVCTAKVLKWHQGAMWSYVCLYRPWPTVKCTWYVGGFDMHAVTCRKIKNSTRVFNTQGSGLLGSKTMMSAKVKVSLFSLLSMSFLLYLTWSLLRIFWKTLGK